MKQPDLSLIIACYNEGKIFEKSIEDVEFILNNSKFSYEIIFVDDKSSDKTVETIKKLTKNKKNYLTIFHEKNKGRGKTVVDGIKVAKGKVVGFIDIDCEVSPVYIPYFVKKILDGHADIVVGRRIYRENIFSIHRAILSRGYSLLVKKTLNIPLNDTESGYKFFNRKKIVRIIDNVKDSHWFWDTEVMTLSYYRKFKIEEIPVLFIRRFDKQSSVKIFQDVKDYLVNLHKFRKRLKLLKYL